MKRKCESSSKLMSAFAAFNKKKRNKTQSHPIEISAPSSSRMPEMRKKPTDKRKSCLKNIDVPESTSKSDEKVLPCGNISAQNCFEWLISSISINNFFEEVWEKKPLHIKRDAPNHYKNIFSCNEFDKILRDQHLRFKENIDVVSYRDGKKQVHTPDGRAYPPVVWDFYQLGCSIRLLNPQTYSRSLWRMCSLLQEYFGSFVGANMYLTPPKSQGFAPHFDDIEAFVIQLEGTKHWKVYSPRTKSEELPRLSSSNFAQNEIGEPVLDVKLNPGDLLYFPRGFIHQAKTVGNEHSLHITLSTYQKNTWGDLLELMLPRALHMAMEEDVEFRRSLPKDYMNFVGVANADKNCPERDAFLSKTIEMTKRLTKYLAVDSAVDQKAKEYIHSSLPPCLTPEEKQNSIHSTQPLWEEGVKNTPELEPDTKIRLIRKRVIRLVMEDDTIRLYHTLENSRIYQQREPQYLELDIDQAIVLETLFNSYPNYITIDKLPGKDLEQQVDIVNLLYDNGLLVTKDLQSDSDSDVVSEPVPRSSRHSMS